LAWTATVMTKIGLSINEEKTSVKDARTEGFDFLGYTFGPKYSGSNGQKYLGASPSRKSLKRIKTKIGDLLVPGNKGSWPQVQCRLNGLLAGWSAYFSYGTLAPASRAVDRHVYVRVRRFLAKRHKVGGRGTRSFSMNAIFGELGVHRLIRIEPRAAPVSLP
jgi:RNA-directed DNA polymerase